MRSGTTALPPAKATLRNSQPGEGLRRLWVNRRLIQSAGEIEGNERSLPPGAPMLPARFALRTAAAEATTATGAALLRARFVDGQATAFELAFVERRAGRLAVVRIRHLDETEPTGLARRTVTDEVDRGHRPNRREEFLELLLVGVERQITDVESHCTFPCKGWKLRA